MSNLSRCAGHRKRTHYYLCKSSNIIKTMSLIHNIRNFLFITLRSIYPLYSIFFSLVLTATITNFFYHSELIAHKFTKALLFAVPFLSASYITGFLFLLWFLELRNKHVNKKIVILNTIFFIIIFLFIVNSFWKRLLVV